MAQTLTSDGEGVGEADRVEGADCAGVVPGVRPRHQPQHQGVPLPGPLK